MLHDKNHNFFLKIGHIDAFLANSMSPEKIGRNVEKIL